MTSGKIENYSNIKMKHLFFVILLFFHWSYSSACDCIMNKNLEEAQKSSFEENELIFVGRVTEIRNDGSYVLEIIELFKGELIDSSLVNSISHNACSKIPHNLYETWLVYTNFNSEGNISISQCGLSRSFESPYYFGSGFFPPPPPDINNPIKILELESQILDIKKKALEELKNEILLLREMKKIR